MRESSEPILASINAKMEEKDRIIEELKEQVKSSNNLTLGYNQVAMPHTDTLKGENFNANISEVLPVVEPSQIEILTKVLLEKQSLLEAVTAEKNTLVLKVESWEVCCIIYIYIYIYIYIFLVNLFILYHIKSL